MFFFFFIMKVFASNKKCSLSEQDVEVSKDDAHKLQNRKWVASAVLDSEKAYLECLNMLCKVKVQL